MSLTEEHHLSITIYFIIRKPSSDDCQDQELKEMAVAMDMTDNDVDMEIRGLPNFSLGFDFLWEVVCANRESTQSSDSSKDKPVMSKETNENCCTKPSFASTLKELRHDLCNLKNLQKFAIRVNLRHPAPSLFLLGLLSPLWYFSILQNYYLVVSLNLKVILHGVKNGSMP